MQPWTAKTRGLKQARFMLQTNTNSGEFTNEKFASPSARIEVTSLSFLGEMLETSQGAIHAKNLISEVFNVFFLSDQFCQRDESLRANYILLLENLQDWTDLCHSQLIASKAEEEASRTLAALEEMREKLSTKKTPLK